MNPEKEHSASGQFPQTVWTQFSALRKGAEFERRLILDFLIRRYWEPVYGYVRRSGHDEEASKDLVQQFFTECLARDLFDQADPAKGRFRNFLVRSLKNFLTNAHRAEQRQKRRPDEGFVSLDELISQAGSIPVPQIGDSPEQAFHRAWINSLILRVLCGLHQEYRASGKRSHFDIFQARIVLPALEGREQPSLAELAARQSLTEKEVANRLITARRAYQRLLRQEIQLYASSADEVADEIQGIFQTLAGT